MNRLTDAKPRIVIYGAGQYGGYVARFAIAKGWPIVAAYNRIPDVIAAQPGIVLITEMGPLKTTAILAEAV